MDYKCELLEQEPQPTLSIRTRTSVKELPQELGKAYDAIEQYLSQLGEEPAGAPYAAYFDFNMDDFEVEIGFPVARPLPEKGEIKNTEIPGGKLAQCLYTGPYKKIKPAYDALTEFVEEKGYEATGVAYEFYLNDVGEVAPEELLTQIVFPLKTA
ncbi:MAG: GyrI-like domain-containing protein [Anaerolineales bacterium]